MSEAKLSSTAGSVRIGKKKLAFLQAIADKPEFMPGRPTPLCWTLMPWELWDSFHTMQAARKWVREMESDGLIAIKEDDFCYLTNKGKIALGQNTEVKS